MDKHMVVNASSLDESNWTIEDPDEHILSVCGFYSSIFFFFNLFVLYVSTYARSMQIYTFKLRKK
jgi:hypothetical protein